MNNSGQYWGMMLNVGSQDWRLGYGGGNSIVGWNLRWDNGSNLGVVPDTDKYEILDNN